MADEKTIQKIQNNWFADPKVNTGAHTVIEPNEFEEFVTQAETEYHKQMKDNWEKGYQEYLKNTFERDSVQQMVRIRKDPNARR